MMEGRGQSGDLQEMDCPYGFIALEAWFQTRIRPSGLGLNGFSTVAPWKERAWIDMIHTKTMINVNLNTNTNH